MSDINEDIIGEFLKCQKRLRALAFAICRDFHMVDDILQEVFLVLIKKEKTFDKPAHFVAWALGVTRFKTYEFIRAQQKSGVSLDDEAMDILAQALDDVAAQEDFERRSEALQHCLEELGDENYEVLNMMYCQRLSAEVISDKLKRTVVATRSLLQRLRRKMLSCARSSIELETY